MRKPTSFPVVEVPSYQPDGSESSAYFGFLHLSPQACSSHSRRPLASSISLSPSYLLVSVLESS